MLNNFMLKNIRTIFNGSVYGMTLVIPGVSATILAIILGFYDELIHTMNHVRENTRKNVVYLILFVIGVAIGAVLFSRLISFFIETFSLPTMLFFVGLLVGIIPLTFRYARGEKKIIRPLELILAIIAMVALYFLTTAFTGPEVDTGYEGGLGIMVILFLFLAGIITGATLVVPGLSGAFILLIMGLYPVIISTVSDIGSFLANPTNFALFFDIVAVLAPFGVGALIGVIFMARLMEMLLKKYKKQVYAVIMGMVIASVAALFQNPIVYQSGVSTAGIIIGIFLCIIGFIAAFLLGKKTD